MSESILNKTKLKQEIDEHNKESARLMSLVAQTEDLNEKMNYLRQYRIVFDRLAKLMHAINNKEN